MKPQDKLQALLDLVDTKQNIEQFVTAFEQVVTYLKKNQDQLGGQVQTVITRLDAVAAKIEADHSQDLDTVKGLVADAIVSLQTASDEKVMERLAQIKDGYTPIKGKDYFDGKTPILGEDYTIPEPIPGSPDTPDEITNKLNASSILIKKERVEGLMDAIRNIASGLVGGAVGITTTFFLKNGTTIGRAKNINFIEGNNVTFTMYQTGDQMNVSASSSATSGGATWVDSEVPSGSGTSFTLAHTPVAGTVKVYRGGARQQVNVDYTLSGTSITLTNALATGEVLVVDYGF